jgi:predicted dehydrogenase|tara:strand:+ start:1585 stop:2484 length:900 start_codon:yes stop_codon:yes gene_type:complete
MKLAVIGTGYWGSKIVETVKNMGLPVTLYDVNDSLDSIVPSLIDGVIIATPAPTHKNITKRMLRKGIHVLVEKPAFMNMAECNEIGPYTANAKLMAGHILLYNEHFDFLKQNIVDKEILHIEHRRLAWGRMQKDINPILHYAPHDIAILDKLLGVMPDEVHSTGIHITRQPQPDFVTCNLKYNKVTVQIQMGWYYHEKVRDVTVITDKGTLVWNDAENKSKWIGQTIENGRQIQHMDQNKIFTESTSSLQRQITAFIDYCEKDKLPDSNIDHIKRVTYIVECMEKSLKTGEVICPSKEY